MEKQFDNSMVMFENEYYAEGGKSPMFKGKLTVNGVDKEFALWAKEKDGKVFYSGKITDPYVKPTQNQVQDPLKKDRDTSFLKQYPEDPMPDNDLPF
jgi:hypothetical protein